MTKAVTSTLLALAQSAFWAAGQDQPQAAAVSAPCVYSQELKACCWQLSFGMLRREGGEAVEPYERGALCVRSEPFHIDSK